MISFLITFIFIHVLFRPGIALDATSNSSSSTELSVWDERGPFCDGLEENRDEKYQRGSSECCESRMPRDIVNCLPLVPTVTTMIGFVLLHSAPKLSDSHLLSRRDSRARRCSHRDRAARFPNGSDEGCNAAAGQSPPACPRREQRPLRSRLLQTRATRHFRARGLDRR